MARVSGYSLSSVRAKRQHVFAGIAGYSLLDENWKRIKRDIENDETTGKMLIMLMRPCCKMPQGKRIVVALSTEFCARREWAGESQGDALIWKEYRGDGENRFADSRRRAMYVRMRSLSSFHVGKRGRRR